MFQFSGLASLSRCYAFSIAGCPIRKSADVTIVCISPQLIAAYHVLHRLSEPRHPPCALSCFKKFETSFWIVVCYPTTSEKDQPKNLVIFYLVWSIIDSRLTTILISNMSKNLYQNPNPQIRKCANPQMVMKIFRLWTCRPTPQLVSSTS